MFELQGHLRPFLRGAAVFKCVGKLISLADAHKKLRLCKQLFRAHTGLLARLGERSEIYVGGEVLLAGSLVRVRTGGVMSIRHERAAVATRELLVAGVTVIDYQQQAARDDVREMTNPILRNCGDFDALAGLGMDAVAIEEFQFLGQRWKPDFVQAIVSERNVKFAVGAENLDGKGIEEFVGKHDHGCVGPGVLVRPGRAKLGLVGQNFRSPRIKMLVQGFLELCSQCRRRFLQRISKSAKELRKFLVRPIEYVSGEQATAGAEFEDFDLRRTVERSPYFLKLPRQQSSEDSVDIARGIEVSGFAELLGIARIVPVQRIVEANLHVAGKRDGTVLADFLFDLFPDGHGTSFHGFHLRQARGFGWGDPAGCG